MLLSDNFDNENGGAAALNYTGFANWNVSNGTVDLIPPGFVGLPEPGLLVDLDGSTNDAGRMETKVTFALDACKYELSFDLAGHHRVWPFDDIVTVSFDLLYTETFVLTGSSPMTTYTRTITGPGSGTIVFDHAGGDNVGILLDNVVLELVGP